MSEITIIIAFFAGLISFLSPCVLPLLPAFLSYLAGISSNDIKNGKHSTMKVFLNALFYVLGFSLVFSLLGVLLNSVFENISYSLNIWLSRIAGTIIILFGLFILGLIKLKFLQKEHKIKIKNLKRSYFTSFLFGASFAVGWTPCVGAVLGAILTLAISSPGIAFYLLLAYSLGLGIPFLLTGLFLSKATGLIQKSQKYLKYFNLVAGVLLIIIGVLVFTGQLSRIANFTFLNNFLLQYQ